MMFSPLTRYPERMARFEREAHVPPRPRGRRRARFVG